MGYIQMTLDDWTAMKEKIRRDMNNVKHAFVRVGYNLRRIRDEELYRQDGYDNLADFAREELGLGASWVSRLIKVNEAYSVDGYSETLLPEYESYKQSALIEMLGIPESDRQMITENTPRETIRELKRFNKEPEAGDLEEVVKEFVTVNEDTCRELAKLPEDTPEEKLAELINPSGSRLFKKGMYFITFTENAVKAKRFGGTPEEITYRTFVSWLLAEWENRETQDEPDEIAPAQKTAQPQEVSGQTGDSGDGKTDEKIEEKGNEKEHEGTAETDQHAAGADQEVSAESQEHGQTHAGTPRDPRGTLQDIERADRGSLSAGDGRGSADQGAPESTGSESAAAGAPAAEPEEKPEETIESKQESAQDEQECDQNGQESAQDGQECDQNGQDSARDEQEIAQQIERVKRTIKQLEEAVDEQRWITAQMLAENLASYFRNFRKTVTI